MKPGSTKLNIWVDDDETHQRYSATAIIVVKGILPTQESVDIDVAEPREVDVTCYGNIDNLSWSSTSGDRIIKLDPNGIKCKIYGNSKGHTEIVAGDGNYWARIKVNVTHNTKVIESDADVLYEGDQLQLKCTLINPFSWVSDNEEIATVDDKGMVTGKTEGYTYIRVHGFKDNREIHDCIKIRVIKRSEIPIEGIELLDYYGRYHFVNDGSFDECIFKFRLIPENSKINFNRPFFNGTSMFDEAQMEPMVVSLGAGIYKCVFWPGNPKEGVHNVVIADILEPVSCTATYEYHPKNEIGLPSFQKTTLLVGETLVIYPTGLTPHSLLDMSEIKVDDVSIVDLSYGNYDLCKYNTFFKVTAKKEGIVKISFHDNFSNTDGTYTIEVKAPDTFTKEIEEDSISKIEYYNLQGIKVQQPERGRIYIKCVDSKFSKIVF